MGKQREEEKEGKEKEKGKETKTRMVERPKDQETHFLAGRIMDKDKIEQEKLDKIAGSMLNAPRTRKGPPAPTKKDLERKFRIVFDSEDEPVFEEVEEED